MCTHNIYICVRFPCIILKYFMLQLIQTEKFYFIKKPGNQISDLCTHNIYIYLCVFSLCLGLFRGYWI